MWLFQKKRRILIKIQLMKWTSKSKIFFSPFKIQLLQYLQGNLSLKWKLKTLYNNKPWCWKIWNKKKFKNRISKIIWFKKRLRIKESLRFYMIKIMKWNLILKGQLLQSHFLTGILKFWINKINGKTPMNILSVRNLKELIDYKMLI